MSKQIKLVIGIPTLGNVHWQFASSLMALQLLPDTRVIWMVRSMIDTARNQIVKDALKDESYTHLLMIDDDMTFDPDFAIKLIERNVDVISGLAFKRRPEYTPCVFNKEKDGKYYPTLPNEFQEVDIVGTGGILINTEVLKKLEYPWFETYYDENKVHWSVDFDFCMKAKKAGYKIYVEPNAEMGHIGDAPIIKKQDFIKHIQKHEINQNNNNGTTNK